MLQKLVTGICIYKINWCNPFTNIIFKNRQGFPRWTLQKSSSCVNNASLKHNQMIPFYYKFTNSQRFKLLMEQKRFMLNFLYNQMEITWIFFYFVKHCSSKSSSVVKLRRFCLIMVVISNSFVPCLQEIATDVESEPSLQEETSIIHHVLTQMSRYQEDRQQNSGQKWKLPPNGQPIGLFSGNTTATRTIIRPDDDSEYSK